MNYHSNKNQIIVGAFVVIIVLATLFYLLSINSEDVETEVLEKDDMSQAEVERESEEKIDFSVTLEDAEKIAEKDIDAIGVTYEQRGLAGSLRLVESKEEEDLYRIKFAFKEVYRGYGRADEKEDVIKGDFSDRTIEVLMYYDRILSIIVDGVFDEIEGVFIEKSEIISENDFEGLE